MAEKRIAFYTKKVAQLGSVHISKRNESWNNRANRLKKYKAAMHNQIREVNSLN